MESPSTNTSERNGVERTVTVPVEGAARGGGGGGGSGAVALSSPAFEKPTIDLGAASSSDSCFFSSAVMGCIGPAVFHCVICKRRLPVADRKYRESPLTSSCTA